jgi:pimeloyl-ACP methyl ester carboxylesterase
MAAAMVKAESGSGEDAALLALQTAYLGRVAPGCQVRRIAWSRGSTQVIELGEGPPLLLVHGGLGEAFQWGPLLPALARRHRVIAVDRPGHGLADAFDHRGVDLIALGREFVAEVMDGEGLATAAICGCSMGGLWSTAFALAHPQRVTRLVLVAAPAGVTRALPMMLRLGTLPGLRALVRRMMRRPTRDSMRGFWGQVLVAHPERLRDDFLDLSAASQRRNADSWFSLIDRSFDVRGMKPDLIAGARFAALTVPTTLVWGERDAFGDVSLGEALAAVNPRLRVVRIADAGHAPWFDAPEAVLAAIEGGLA